MRLLLTAAVSGAVLCAGVALAPAASANAVGDSQGCRAGYWKAERHLDSWQEAAPTDSFAALFGMTSMPPGIPADLTMLGALQLEGGARLAGARRLLVREAAAAYLNSAYDSPDGSAMLFPYRRQALGYGGEAPLIPTVALTLRYGSNEVVRELAAQLRAANGLGCPLG